MKRRLLRDASYRTRAGVWTLGVAAEVIDPPEDEERRLDSIGALGERIEEPSAVTSSSDGTTTTLVGPMGPAGPAGPAGPPGPEGPPGAAGATGPKGDQGAPGASGPQGNVGPPGPAGLTGAAGAAGAQGPEGPRGPAGDTGPAGPIGPKGDAGPTGPAGAGGQIGPTGPKGDAGPQGLKGDTGLAGPQGPKGDMGPAGPAGADSIVPGPQGPPGPTPFVVARQAADLTIATASFVNTDLVFDFEAASTYLVDLFLLAQAVAATTGFRFAFDTSVPVTVNALTFEHQLAAAGTLSGGDSIADDTARGISSGLPAAGALVPVLGMGLIVASAQAGTARLRFGPEVAASATFKANSVLRAHRAF